MQKLHVLDIAKYIVRRLERIYANFNFQHQREGALGSENPAENLLN